jgi:phosphoenolpyruvate carboxylase
MFGPFGGVRITIVEPGTVVGVDRDGNPMIVTDERTVFSERFEVWVTRKVYDKIEEATNPSPKEQGE